MTILVVSVQRPFAGPSRSRRRSYFIPAPPSVSTTSLISPRSGPRRRRQGPMRYPQRLSASPISSKPSSANAAAWPNPHRRPTARRRPAGSFFGGFRTPAPLHRADCSCRAGIRNPYRKRSLDTDRGAGSIRPQSGHAREAESDLRPAFWGLAM